MRIVVLAQYQDEAARWQSPDSLHVIACAREQGIAVLDLYPDLAQIAKSDPGRFRSFFQGHMTREGNAFVAKQVCAFLKNSGWLQ